MALSLVLLLPSLIAQVTDDDEALAYQLKRKYPDERTACSSSVEEYDFDIGKGDGNGPVVTAVLSKRVEFISLREASMATYVDYYDKFSVISKMKQYYKYNNSFSPYKTKPIDKSATSGDIFYDDSRMQMLNIVVPKMGMGAMVEEEKRYLDARYLTRIMFHSYYPIKEHIIRFKVPSGIRLDLREINFTGYKIDKSTQTEGKKTVYSYKIRDLAPWPSENNSLPINYTFPHLVVLIKSFDADGKTIKGFESGDDLYNWCNFLYKKTDNQSASFKNKADELVRGKSSETDKVRSIFYWVQDNIRYIAFEDGYAGFIPQTAQEVFKNKYGDCKGMANLLTEMLKTQGLDAHYTWIGTKHIPYSSDIPSLCLFNHCISTVYIGGKPFFLDATEKYVPLGQYAYRIQGKEAMIAKGDNHEFIKVPVADKSQNKILTQADFSLDDNHLVGHVKMTFTGEERTDFHQYYQDLPTDKKKEFLQNMLEFGNDNLVATNIKTSDLTNRESPVSIEGDIDLSNNVIRDDKEVYAGIDFYPKKLSRYMPDDKRVNPYEFNSIYTTEDEISVNLAGYKVRELPEAMNQQAADYGFSGSYQQNGNKLVLKKSLTINTGTVKIDDFANWKDFLKKLKDFNNNMVVAVKDPNYVAPKINPVTTPVKTNSPKPTPVKSPSGKPIKQ